MGMHSALWTGITGVVKATWMEITDPKIFRMSQINRVNWETEENKGRLTAPYVIIDLMEAVATDFGTQNQTFMQSGIIAYIASRIDDGAYIDPGDHTKGRDAEAFVKQKAEGLCLAMISWKNGGFHVMEEHPAIISSDGLPQNEIFQQLIAKKICSVVHFNVLIGQTPLS